MCGNIPAELALQLRDIGKLEVFVETGTYLGTTMRWAAPHFKQVVTIEKSAELFADLDECNLPNVYRLLGDSKELLPEVIRGLWHKPALFWLDAHWSGGATAGEEAECPLMGELEAIMNSDTMHYILIDDARMFLEAVPVPHNHEHWPTFEQIDFDLRQRGYAVGVIVDVIVAVPPDVVSELAGKWMLP